MNLWFDRLEAAVAATEDAVDLAIVDIDDFSDLALGILELKSRHRTSRSRLRPSTIRYRTLFILLFILFN